MATADQSMRHLTHEVVAEIATNDTTVEESNATETASTVTEQGLWQSFDQQAAEMTQKRTPNSDAVEMQQYLKHKYIDQKEDPLMWWKQNRDVRPQLQHLALKYWCIPETSVPAERLFSKAGENSKMK